MSTRLFLLTVTALGCLCGLAQEKTPGPVPQAKPAAVSDSVQEFFDSLNSHYPSDEVVSQLSPPTPLPLVAKPAATPTDATPTAATPTATPTDATPTDATPTATPVATTPDATTPAATTPVATTPAATPVATTRAATTPAATERLPSLSVQVEKLQTGSGTLDPKTVKLLAPFPAKPLAAIPSGWRLEASTHAPPFIRKVELAPGASITLNIRPHLLVPDANGSTVFSIAEPGFDPALGYRQAQTVSAILASSIQQLDEDAKQLGHAIAQLQQLVSSLPQPAPKPLPITPAPFLKQANKK